MSGLILNGSLGAVISSESSGHPYLLLLEAAPRRSSDEPARRQMCIKSSHFLHGLFRAKISEEDDMPALMVSLPASLRFSSKPFNIFRYLKSPSK